MEVTAAVLREVGGDFGLEKVHLDAPRPGEVLVQISAVGSATPTWRRGLSL